MDLSPYHGKRFAIVLRQQDSHRVYRGEACYVNQPRDGNMIRIFLDDRLHGNPEFVICEDDWHGEIVPDHEFGCDYRIEMTRRAS